MQQQLPMAVPLPPLPMTRTTSTEAIILPPPVTYFVVTAVSGVLESLPSNEVLTTNRPAELIWEYPPEQMSSISGFRLYYGPSSGTYKGSMFVGTNLTAVWPPVHFMPTNIVLRWNAPAGTVEGSSDLVIWSVLTNVFGSTVTFPIQTGAHFYRVSSDRQTTVSIEAQ